MRIAKNPTSIRMSPTAMKMRDLLAEKLGVPKSSIIEMAIRKFAEQEGIIFENKSEGPNVQPMVHDEAEMQ